MKLYLTIAVGMLSLGLASSSSALYSTKSVVVQKTTKTQLLPCSKCPNHCCGSGTNRFCCLKKGGR
jgi:hypothetical protein